MKTCMSCQNGWHGSCRGEKTRIFYEEPCACAERSREHKEELRALREKFGTNPGSVVQHLPS